MADDKGTDDQTTEPATGEKDWRAEAEKYKALARKHEERAKANYEELQKLRADQDASKSDMDKIRDQLAALEKRAAEAERKALLSEVAAAKGLTPAQAKRLVGSTREELEADADELLATFAGKSGKDEAVDDRKPATGQQRPREKLTAGTVPAASDDVNPAQLAEQILKSEI